jgi:hypothetical protein
MSEIKNTTNKVEFVVQDGSTVHLKEIVLEYPNGKKVLKTIFADLPWEEFGSEEKDQNL